MEMKWHPIEAGSMKGVPRDEDVLFTAIDEYTGEFYTTVGEVDDFFIEQGGYIFAGKKICSPVSIESLVAWMKLPEPFIPGRCDGCEYLEQAKRWR